MPYYAQQGYVEINFDVFVSNLQAGASGRFYVDNHTPVTLQGLPEKGCLLFAHGAGAGQDSDFMRQFATSAAQAGIQLMTFDFIYMQRMNMEGRRRPPAKIDQLVTEMSDLYASLVATLDVPVWVGGKSMGGRVASLLAAQRQVPGVIVAGYPFHPPRSPDKLRLAHWGDVSAPSLLIQGERDPFGRRDEVASYTLPANAKVEWLPTADHDFRPLRKSGWNQEALIKQATRIAADFMLTNRDANGI
ncbi:MAG: alpha/beta fold hydrolase [Pseudomonadota bacterium]